MNVPALHHAPPAWKKWSRDVQAAFAKLRDVRSGVGIDVNNLQQDTATVNRDALRRQGDRLAPNRAVPSGGGGGTGTIGACCIDGACSLRTEADCISAGGTFQGIGTICHPNPCSGPCTLPDGPCPHALCWEVKFNSSEQTSEVHPANGEGQFMVLSNVVPGGTSTDRGAAVQYFNGTDTVQLRLLTLEYGLGEDFNIYDIPNASFFDTWLPMKLECITGEPYGYGPNSVIITLISPFGSGSVVADSTYDYSTGWASMLLAGGVRDIGDTINRAFRNIHLVPNPSTGEPPFDFLPDSWDSSVGGVSVVGDELRINDTSLAYARKNIAYDMDCVPDE